MAGLIHSNNYRTTTTASLTAVATTLPVTSVTGLPAIGSGVYCYLTLQNGSTIEIVKATAVSSLNITIVRAQQSTTATTFASGSIVSLRPTKESFDSKEPLISGATYTAVTVATDDKVIIQDTSDSNNVKTVTAQSIANLSTGLTDGDKGDITVSGTGTVWTIDNDVVTYAKMQNLATNTLLGRSTAGSGDAEEIVCTAAGRALIDDADATAQRTTLGLGTLATQSGTFSGTSSGTNTGDQTSIVGITGTKAQFNTAVTDGDIVYVGDSIVDGYTTTATAAGTTTLTVSSTKQQFFTGSTTQTVVLPVASTLTLGQSYRIVNNSTGVVTVQSSGANTIVAMAAATILNLTCILTSGTSTASWDYVYSANASGITGTGSLVRATSSTLVAPLLGTPTSGVLTNCTGTASGLTAGTVTTNANLTGDVTSVGNAATLSTALCPGGRLTLVTATPVMVTDQAAKTTIYYTPYIGDRIPLYNGTSISMTMFTELSVATSDTTKSPAAIGASKVNDWFVWSDSGTIRVGHGPDWTNDTTRSAGTALVLQNGIYLNSVSITNGPAASRGTYVGTTRSNASSQLDWILGGSANDGSPASLFVWNAYNRVSVGRVIKDSRTSHSWTTASFQGINGTTGMRVTAVFGLNEDATSASFTMVSTTSSNAVPLASGIGIDSTTVNSGSTGYTYFNTTNTNIIAAMASYKGNLGLGVHYVAALEYGGTGATQYGVSSPAENGMDYLIRM